MSLRIITIVFLSTLLNIDDLKAQYHIDSVLNYERLVFKAKNYESKFNHYYNYIIFLKSNNKLQEEYKILNEVEQLYESIDTNFYNPTIAKIYYEKQLCSYYLNDYTCFAQAYNAIRRLPEKDSLVLLYSEYMNALLYIDLGYYADAKLIVKEIFKNDTLLIDSIFSTYSSSKLSNGKKQMLMFFPPLGQIKLGYYKEGVVSLLLLSGTLTAYIFTFPVSMYLLGNLGVLPIFIRSYIGGRQFVKKMILAEQAKSNNANKDAIKESLLHLLSQKTE